MESTFGSGATEKRWAKRIGINATIKLKSIKSGKAAYELNEDAFAVTVVNISKGGMAFRTVENLPLSSYYDADVVIWTKETFNVVIQIVRMEKIENSDEILYGCKFIGMSPGDQFKIDVYQIISET